MPLPGIAVPGHALGGGLDSYTKLLLHMDGADASTAFTDSSPSAHTVTASGNAQIDTAQSKFGGASGLFDGTGDTLYLDGSSDFAFGTGDFTVDFWLRLNSASGAQNIFDHRPTSTNGAYANLYFQSGALNLWVNSAVRITGGSLTTETWYHVALARSGASTKLFVDGVQVGSTWTDTTDYLNPANRPCLGLAGTTGLNGLNGWLDEFRISKGIARWTSNFTPPAGAYS